MTAGLALLRLSPADFWRMTPRELAAALGPGRLAPGRAAPGRDALLGLMRRFPDELE